MATTPSLQLIANCSIFSRFKKCEQPMFEYTISWTTFPQSHACKGDKDILRPKSITCSTMEATTCTHMVPITSHWVGWLLGISYARHLEVAHGTTQCKIIRETTKTM